jgi:S1-C subfamily serine protease
VELVAAPETVPREQTPIAGNTPLAGAVVANLSPAVAEELSLPANATGLVIADVTEAPAARYFKKGDILLNVNGADTASVADLRAALENAKRRWLFVVNRAGRTIQIQLRG